MNITCKNRIFHTGLFELVIHFNSRISIADGTLLSPLETHHETEMLAVSHSTLISDTEPAPNGFDMTAKLKVFKFNTAAAHNGKLHLSVIYDTNLAGLLNLTSPTKALKIQIPSPVRITILC